MSGKFSQVFFNSSAKKRAWQVFILIMLLVIGAALVDGGKYYNSIFAGYLPKMKEIPFRLGLDLQGGTQLIYNANVENISDSDQNEALNGVRDVIERRINVFGVSEPLVTTNKTIDGAYRVTVELAGIKDVNEAIKMIGETPLLEFKEIDPNGKQLTADESKQIEVFNKQAEAKAEEALGKLISGGDFSAIANEYSQDETTKGSGGDLGWISEANNPSLANVVKNFKIGQQSQDLGKTEQGYEIVKLKDIRAKRNPLTDKEEKQVKASHLLICYQGASSCSNTRTKDEAYKKIQELKNQATAKNFSDLVKANSDEPGAADRAGDLGWFGSGMMVPAFEEVVFKQSIGTISDIVETEFGYHIIFKQEEKPVFEYNVSHIFVRTMSASDIVGNQDVNWKNTELTGKNLQKATVQFNPNDNTPQVSLEFDSEGSDAFAAITERNVGKQVAIFLDGYVISAPTVNEKITGGKAVITGQFSVSEAKLLAQRLNAGALPVPIELVSQKTVGATLGQKSIDETKKAAAFGFLLVALFMIFYYRLPGFLSVLSLAIYGLLMLAIFKLASFTLTLAGLAGFILSIGIAVDANVLIFERLREELRGGKPLDKALEDGFRRAWPSIRDGNISTIITCLILIFFTTSVVKGFAITLLIGILTSMFSAIIITKNFLNLIAGQWLEKRISLIGRKK